MKILAVHGVGRHTQGSGWQEAWETAIKISLARVDNKVKPKIAFVTYDDLFDSEKITTLGTAEAIAKLGWSGFWYGIGDTLTSIFGRRSRGLGRDISESIRWTAGMVVQWVENENLRTETRVKLAVTIHEQEPDVILAHSLGSLIAYDTFLDPNYADIMTERVFVSFGSQIGNPFVRAQFAGRIVPINCKHWYHLYNAEDDIFAAPLFVSAPNFEQVDCLFDIKGFADHEAADYLSHTGMSQVVWDDMLSSNSAQTAARKVRLKVRHGGRHKRRALLVGIDAYPDPNSRLEGCVNDVYLMSSMLQDCGFEAKDIRIVLNERATAKGIRERIQWLLDGVRCDDERILFYSGHGAQIPDYGADETVDRLDECLVAWDFDWTRENAVTDDWFHEVYSQLDYGARFIAVFDCCHSGGMTRTGLGRPRGLEPPEDIRHRMLVWNRKTRCWQPRHLVSPNMHLGTAYVGESGYGRRLGTAVDLLPFSDADFNNRRDHFKHHGPYMPVLIQACQENQLAFEYRHGNIAYGAFTYNLVEELHAMQPTGISLKQLADNVGERLRQLGYDQQPQIVGPANMINQKF